jgi:magnesium chelatase accessory protein
VSRNPDWTVHGADWPNRAVSRFVDAGGYCWHVQQMGSGPVCLLLHGTGAATHSWRDVMPLLAKNFTVIAIDLPGHGFTRANFSRKVTLPGMAGSVGELLDALEVVPDLIVGHSAGVAVAAQLMLDRGWAMPLIGFTPALMPFPGLAARLFPSLAKILFTNPFVAVIFSRWAATKGETRKFLERATGSRIDAAGELYYQRLFATSGHCDGAIRMMANWQLEPLRDRLSQLAAPVVLLHAARDNAIPKTSVLAAAALIPGCESVELRGLGHLAHEEDPAQAAAIIGEFAESQAAT